LHGIFLLWYSHTSLGEERVLQKSLERTGPADKSLVGHNAVATLSTNNYLPTFRTLRRRIARRVLELLEIVLIGGHIHIVLGVEAFPTRFAGLPGTRMTLVVVIGTERVAIVIAPAAIAGIRKQHIRVAIITDPVVTTRRFGYFPGFPTQTTTRLGYPFVCRFCHRVYSPSESLLLSHCVARRLSSFNSTGRRKVFLISEVFGRYAVFFNVGIRKLHILWRIAPHCQVYHRRMSELN